MDILDFFWTFYLNHLNPLQGYFFSQKHKSAISDMTPPTYTSNQVYMYAGGFRGHKSWNRIQLSQFVQELL